MTNEEKAQEIYNIIYKQCVEDGYHEKITTTCAIMGKAGAEIMAGWKDEQLQEAKSLLRECYNTILGITGLDSLNV